MTAMSTFPTDLILRIETETEINAPVDVVWESIIEEISTGFANGKGEPQPLKLELWPGGRWYRDLGDKTGHFWGHVQVVKPNKLLELTGPMFMSFAVASHVQYRLTENGAGTILKMKHNAVGDIPAELRLGVTTGWNMILDRIKARAQR